MATFAQWLAEQKDRQDAVGWFSRYWKNLDGKPRLSSPSSIASHLEDRQAPGGFRDPAIQTPDGTVTGDQLRQAYDETLKEYRAVRAQIVQAAAAESGVPVPQGGAEPVSGAGAASGPPEPAQAVSGPAGEAVQRASAAGVSAAERARQAAAARHSVDGDLARIEAKLDLVIKGLDLLCERAGIDLNAYDPQCTFDWAEWFEQADLAAQA